MASLEYISQLESSVQFLRALSDRLFNEQSARVHDELRKATAELARLKRGYSE